MTRHTQKETDQNNELACPVNSHTEWDPLEEVIVGRLEHAVFNMGIPQDRYINSKKSLKEIEKHLSISQPYPKKLVTNAQKSLDQLVNILKSEGITVRRPDRYDFQQGFSTPSWKVSSAFCTSNPRDLCLIIGNEILETPMACRERYFELFAYKTLFKEYFQAGAKWTSAPRPELLGDLYEENYKTKPQKTNGFCLTEFEPVFDAADFVRCGRDIFGQLSHVTNKMGVEWLSRHLDGKYQIHIIENRDPKAWHIDTSFMPLAPGKVLVNPEFVDLKKIPSILKTWDILVAPPPVPYKVPPKVMSDWISINTLMLDQRRIIVEKRQKPLIRALKDWGFSPIPCSFEAYYPFLGGFHCATLDVRRTGSLQSYF